MDPIPNFSDDDQVALTVALQAAVSTLALVMLNTDLELAIGEGEHVVQTVPWLTGVLHQHGHPETLDRIQISFGDPEV